MVVSIANIALRGLTMSGRFLLLVALARYLSPAEVGMFALFSAAAQWGVYLQGLELHLFSARELVSADRTTWARRTRDAFALYGLVFAGSLVVWTALFASDLMPMRLLGWFVVILAIEHAAQELYRLLNVFGRPLAGSFVLFLRTGSWNYVAAAVMWLHPPARTLDVIWLAWLVGGALSLVLGAIVLRDLPWRGLPAIDWAWLRRGMRVGLPLLAGSLAAQGTSLFDRWYVGFTHGDTTLGVYGFFVTIAFAIPTLAQSGIGAVLYPNMMKAWQLGDRPEYRRRMRAMWLGFTGYLLAVVPAAAVALHLLVAHLHHPEYAGELDLFYVLLAVAAVETCSAVAQYALWARHQDRAMIAIPIAGFCAAVILDLFLVPVYGAYGAAFGQLGASALALALRLGVLTVADRRA
jgi:O-antigen/teichoic acid export membrane protein